MRFRKNAWAGRFVLAAVAVSALYCALLPASAHAQAADANAAPVVPATGVPHPIEAFAALPFMEGPRLSPDGTRVAAKVAVKGEQRLVIIDDRGGKRSFARVIDLGGNDLNWWRWVNNDWLIAGIGNEDILEGIPFYVRRTAAIPVEGKSLKLLAKNRAGESADDVIWVARDGSPIIYLSLQGSVYSDDAAFWPNVERIDVSTGKSKQIVAPREGVADWYADAAGNVRMGIGYDDERRSSKLYYRSDNGSDFKVVDKANKRLGENLTIPSLFLADPGQALVIDDGDGFAKVKKLDLATLAVGETVYEVQGYDVSTIYTDVAGSGLAGVGFADTRWKVNWLDPVMAEVQANLDKAVGTSRWAQIVSMSQDRKTLMVEVGGPDRMGTYYKFELEDGTMHLFARVSDKFGGTPFAPVKPIHYKARDGLEIEALLTVPAGKEAKNLPLIIMPHGGPATRDLEEWDWIAQFLADRGYAVIQPNYRGSTGYGSAFEEKGQGQWGLAMQDDLNDAVDWMVAQGMADAKRVCVVGGSYGGYAALRGAQRDGGRFRCAISYAGVSDLAGIVKYDGTFFNNANGAKAYFKSQAPDFSLVSPLNYANQFSAPVLIMHGKLDRRVPVKQSREMAEKLKAAGKTVRYVEQPEGDHFFSREADRLQFLQEMEAFLKQYNPA
ncbi:MAG: S9 family peptidase [Sphingobium sp.]|nr:S9 family peptidase [Sphingobium sp.]